MLLILKKTEYICCERNFFAGLKEVSCSSQISADLSVRLRFKLGLTVFIKSSSSDSRIKNFFFIFCVLQRETSKLHARSELLTAKLGCSDGPQQLKTVPSFLPFNRPPSKVCSAPRVSPSVPASISRRLSAFSLLLSALTSPVKALTHAGLASAVQRVITPRSSELL